MNNKQNATREDRASIEQPVTKQMMGGAGDSEIIKTRRTRKYTEINKNNNSEQ